MNRRFLIGSPVTQTAHVPRRYSLGVLMCLMLIFAVGLTVFRWMRWPYHELAVWGLFMLSVAAGQSMWGEKYDPRWISFGVGIVYWLGVLGVYILLPPQFQMQWKLIPSVHILAFRGGILGYTAGTLIAGPFLWKRRAATAAVASGPWADEVK